MFVRTWRETQNVVFLIVYLLKIRSRLLTLKCAKGYVTAYRLASFIPGVSRV